MIVFSTIFVAQNYTCLESLQTKNGNGNSLPVEGNGKAMTLTSNLNLRFKHRRQGKSQT
jgi:hypothetical protein